MNTMFPLVLSITIYSSLAFSVSEQPPLCIICGCKFQIIKNIYYADVTCPSKLPFDIFNVSYWKNVTTGKSYKYHSLNIQKNAFGNLSTEFPSSDLVYLKLANNTISNITTRVFRNLESLKVLVLSNNAIQTLEDDITKNGTNGSISLQYSREIRLDHNKISKLDPNIFKHITFLEILDLSYNPLQINDQQTLTVIKSLEHLRELYLQNTLIKTLPNGMLHTLKFLEILDISGNPIKVIPKNLDEVQKLTNLYMNNTELTELTNQNLFPDMPSVKVLHLCHNHGLIHTGRNCFSGLKNLQEIRLSNNEALSQIDRYSFAASESSDGNHWLKIQKLYLENNNLSNLVPDITGEWDHLVELDIAGNPWECVCKNKWLIQKLYPKYLKINKGKSETIHCATPENMVDLTFQKIYENMTLLKCSDNPDDNEHSGSTSTSTTIPTLIGFFSGFLVAIPLVTLIILGYQRKWYLTSKFAFRRSRTSDVLELNSDEISVVTI